MIRKHPLAAVVAAALLLPVANAAHASCGFENETPIKVLASQVSAWKAITDAMAACGNVEVELDQAFRDKQPDAFAADPATIHIGGVANTSIVPLLEADSIRPLDDLVAKHGQHLSSRELIKIDGKIMAIATMLNTQHLMYRKDILEELSLEPPGNYDGLIATANVIKDSGLIDYPLGGTYKTGWDLAEEFVNLYLGFGDDFVTEDKKPAINGETGLKTLRMMKALSDLMPPDYLEADSTTVQEQMQRGEIAMANLWASRAPAMNDPDKSQVVDLVGMDSAPRVIEAGKPATTLWWDGIVIAKNISDDEAEAAFKVALEGMDEGMVKANNNLAVWLVDGYMPPETARGAIATAVTGAIYYPSTVEMSLMHSALGDHLAGFFKGEATAEETLAAVEKAYLDAAEASGLTQ